MNEKIDFIKRRFVDGILTDHEKKFMDVVSEVEDEKFQTAYKDEDAQFYADAVDEIIQDKFENPVFEENGIDQSSSVVLQDLVSEKIYDALQELRESFEEVDNDEGEPII